MFVAGAGNAKVKGVSDADQAMVAALTAALAAGRRRWPALNVADDVYRAYVLERVGDVPSAAAIESMKHDELYLCCGCAEGDSTAASTLEEHYLVKVSRAIVKLRLSSAATEELLQQLRVDLFVGREDQPPKICKYAGQGSLEGWLRVVAVRTGLNRKRLDKGHVPADSLLLEHVGNADDAELAHIKHQYKSLFTGALTWAFRQLSSEQRTLLRMYVTDGLTVEQLGTLHDVNKGTVSRWLTKIRSQLLEDTRARLIDQHGMRASECDSIMRAVRTGLHLSGQRLLAEGDE